MSGGAYLRLVGLGAVIGIPAGIFVVYRRYREYF